MLIFGTEIATKTEFCSLNGTIPHKVERPYIDMYIRLQNMCNASCSFCAFCGNYRRFDEEKCRRTLEEIVSKTQIGKCSFTGGEPTLDFPLFERMVRYVKSLDKNISTVVNTNGLHLDGCVAIQDYIDSIALSRHHYDDTKNQLLFQTEVPNTTKIRAISHDKLHLSCNLVKGFIDSPDEIVNYLDWCAENDIDDVGFVSLMPVNDFCSKHFVDYDDVLTTLKHKRFMQTKDWKQGNVCRCVNYVYAGNNGNIVRAYARYYVSGKGKSASQLVFDIDCLREGFNGKIIY